MAKRTSSLAALLLLCGIHSAFPKGSGVLKDDPWNPHHIEGLPVEVRQYIAGSAKGHQELNMISQPTHRSRDAGASIWNTSTARAWANFVEETNVSMSISLMLVPVFGSPQNSIGTAVSEPIAIAAQPIGGFQDARAGCGDPGIDEHLAVGAVSTAMLPPKPSRILTLPCSL
jgi:hypothetical protein